MSEALPGQLVYLVAGFWRVRLALLVILMPERS